ncbi:MAG: XRE family transcriptional regulator [Bacilli bacterium]|nr:XRE family transcriptional regulator [Bacilli bacterium]
MDIGVKIKRLRVLCQLTQEELANRCELTKGYISQIENDLTSPSISTLTDILIALGTNLKEFFNDGEDDEKIVFTKEDYIVKEEKNHTMTWLVPNSQKNEMEPILFTLEANSETTIDMPHEGQEFGYILEGEIVIVLGGKNISCKKGETFYFTTDKNHYLKNTTRKIAKIIWVTSPPNF